MAVILDDSPAHIARLAQALLEGRLVAVPTETVYGLAAHALDAVACARIFEAKGRPAHDPLIVHVSDLAMLDRVAESRPEVDLWPKPSGPVPSPSSSSERRLSLKSSPRDWTRWR